ncbi:MAG TPA: NUDIX domain-containing protein [Caulobacteraceae bacterium]|nr:NUDIX domain-containing protein [Caulobacteraceae bacterium]
MPWRRRLSPIAQPFYRLYAGVSRGMTLGVRGVVFNERGEVLLVEHTYIHGWHLPGGGVERGETAEEAVARELVEEAGVRALERPRLLSIHSNHRRHRGDHVLVYRVDAWAPCEATAIGEILDRGWFAPDHLPAGTTAATRQRIAEAVEGKPGPGHW